MGEPLPTRTKFVLLLLLREWSLPESEAKWDVAPVSMYHDESWLSSTDMVFITTARSVA